MAAVWASRCSQTVKTQARQHPAKHELCEYHLHRLRFYNHSCRATLIGQHRRNASPSTTKLPEVLGSYGIDFKTLAEYHFIDAHSSQAEANLTCMARLLAADAPSAADARVHIRDIVHACPRILTCDLPAWAAFFSAYGAPASFLPALLRRSPNFFPGADLFNAGRVLLCLRQLGLRDDDLLLLVVLEVPGVLGLDVEAELLPRLRRLAAQGLDTEGVADEVLRDPMGRLCADWEEER